MRERTRLDTAINGYYRVERELSDALEMIELAEAESDQGMVADAQTDLAQADSLASAKDRDRRQK